MNASLADLHQALIDAIKAVLPQLDTVDVYRIDDNGKIATPAALIDLESIEEETGPWSPAQYRLGWRIYCVLSRETQKVELATREFALSVLRLLHGNRFGFDNVSEPSGVSAQPLGFQPTQHGYEGWRVDFEQVISFDVGIDESTLDDFLICHNTLRLDAPAPTAEDHIPLHQE